MAPMLPSLTETPLIGSNGDESTGETDSMCVAYTASGWSEALVCVAYGDGTFVVDQPAHVLFDLVRPARDCHTQTVVAA